jgi:hypothetical protein
MRELEDSPLMRSMREFQDSPAMRAMRELEDSPLMRSMREFQDSPAMRAMREFENSPVMLSIREFQNAPIIRALRGLQSSPLLDSLTRLSGAPFDPELVRQAAVVAEQLGQRWQREQEGVPEELAATEQELERLGDGTLDFQALSESGRRSIVWFFCQVVLPFLISVAASLVVQHFHEKAVVGERVTTPKEARKLAKCSNNLEKEIFAGCRVVTGDGLRLRARPSIKASVITYLPLGKVVVVLDCSERRWLLVEADVDGDLVEGWVSRRYTTPFR